jgi:hypothetical protein
LDLFHSPPPLDFLLVSLPSAVWARAHEMSHVESSGDGVERRGEWVEGLVGLTRRQVRAINWGWCGRAG